jgi:hypothetical protein
MMGYRARPEAITAAAAQRGITPSTPELAAVTGIRERTMYRVRAGCTVARRTAEGLAAELGVSVEQLFDAVEVR